MTVGGNHRIQSRNCPHKIRQHSIRRRGQARILLGDRQNAKDVCVEANIRRSPPDSSHWSADHDFLWTNTCFYSILCSLCPTHELVWQTVHASFAEFSGAKIANSFALDLVQSNRHIHQHGDERGGFYRRVPAVDVVRSVGFGDAELLCFFQSGVRPCSISPRITLVVEFRMPWKPLRWITGI
jgi:hypothetical protein